MQWHTADWIILGVFALSMAFGFYRGFVREAFALAGWVAAYVVARVFHAPLELQLADTIATPSLRLVVAWGGLFVTTLLLAALAGYMVLSLVEKAGLRLVDRCSRGRFRHGACGHPRAGRAGPAGTFCRP